MNKGIYVLIFAFISHVLLAGTPEEIIKSLYSSDIQEVDKMPTNIELKIETKDIELNGKPPTEIMARFLHPYFCGTLGCKTIIIGQNEGGWNQITPYLITHGELEITNQLNNGYFSIKFDNGKLWQYNGEKYQ